MIDEFKPFNKIPRLMRECVVTEKLDGTNAQVVIESIYDAIERDPSMNFLGNKGITRVGNEIGEFLVRAASRNRWISPEEDNDNYRFARWVAIHALELADLGVGRHFGEWWGQGIQRNYGLKEKRFSLFNTERWNTTTTPPACCHVVPVLYRGIFDLCRIGGICMSLPATGSAAAPGFHDPEGVIIFHTASGQLFKRTCKDDEQRKTQIV